MSTLTKELVYLVLQFFDEEGFKESMRTLARESGYHFDLKFFEEMVLDGKWEEVERYLSSFTKVDDNRYSTKIYFEVRKRNFLEALDCHDHAKALNILLKDLKVFAPNNEKVFKEMTQLLTLDDIREHDSLSMYGDTKSARKTMMLELEKIIEANPLLHDKLKFPHIKSHRLRRLINQSLNWQHIHCTNPQPNPDINTLFVDHVCQSQDCHLIAQSTESNVLPSQATAEPVSTSTTCGNSSPSMLTDSAVSTGASSLIGPKNPDVKMEGLEDSDIIPEKRSFHTTDGVILTVNYPGPSHSSLSHDLPIKPLKNDKFQTFGLINHADLPQTVVQTLKEGSSPVSMDFHPLQHAFLLVGTNIGDIGLWDVNYGEKLLSRKFKVWHIGACSMLFKTALVKDPFVSVNCISWSPDGSFFGVAFSKHIVQLYSYHGGSDVRQHLEMDAHVGSVNNLAFSVANAKLLVITCGVDKTIKVWDVVCGVKKYTFEGHDAPVYSLCPHTKERIPFIFSTSVDGKIKAWLYDNLGARVNFDAPGLGCTRMAYSANDQRLFSCGTAKNGQSFLVEWEESEGAIKRTYQGLRNNPLAVVQFDTAKDRFLAAGDDHIIKIWDMDQVELFTTIDADGGLPANPHIRFNKQGTLLAVIANENRIKILATNYALRWMHTSENCSIEASRVLSDTLRKLALNPISTVASAEEADGGVPVNDGQKVLKDVKSETPGAANNQSKVGMPLITRPSQCKSLQLPSHLKADKISRLIYTNTGNAILALASNAIHLFWKWPKNELNLSGKATAKVLPQLWQPRNSPRIMVNDLTGSNPHEAVPCFALSKNDSYLMSASGGVISLFNMMTFKTMMTIMPPSPVATCLAFHPQDNNIVAIGMDDSTIVIYNVRFGEIKSKLKGHSKRVTGLAFSDVLDIIVSSGADGQILVWSVDNWVLEKSLQIPDKNMLLSDTQIQFHQDQTQFLAFNETHLAIYEAKELKCLKKWVPVGSASISQAIFSCDSQMVYASFLDGTVSIFDASNLELRCRILPTAYLPPRMRSSAEVYPHAIAAHPQKPSQFAVGLTDGGVHVFEPQEPGDDWAVLPPDENESAVHKAMVD